MSRLIAACIVRSCIAAAMVVFALGAARAQPAADLSALVARHVNSPSDDALHAFLAWPPGRIEQASRDYSRVGPWSDFALVLLHTEAALRADAGRAWEVHAQAIERLTRQRVWPAVAGNVDPVWRDALRQWLVVLILGAPAREWDVRAMLDDDAPVQLAWGIRDEFWMGPVIDSPQGRGYTFDEGPPYVITAHGRFSSRRAERAMASFRTATRLDPSLHEARLRLGWVQGRIGRLEDAMANLEGVIAAAGTGDVSAAYLAHLFRGRLLATGDNGNRRDAAVAEFHAAAQLGPWSAARLELIRHALLEGDAPPALVGATSVDPWSTYPRGKAWWERFDRLRSVRPLVGARLRDEQGDR